MNVLYYYFFKNFLYILVDFITSRKKAAGLSNMADFTQKSVVKSAVRTLASPIANLTTFNDIVQDIIVNNPWGCTTYQSAGVNKPAVEKTSQYFSGKVIYEDAEAKTIGNVTIKANSTSGFNTVISNTLANTALTSAMAGSPHMTVQKILSVLL